MPDFSRPEYRSYVELCRGLRLERRLQDGDWYVVPSAELPDVPQLRGRYDGYYGPPADAVWLPQLADWLEMLEEAGRSKVPAWTKARTLFEVASQMNAQPQLPPEEAAARLWMAVSGKASDPKGPSGT